MNFCSECGLPVTVDVPPGEDRPRAICKHCNVVHYENPKVLVACIPEWKDQILLCRRAIGPRQGLWGPPGGFLESGETVTQAAIREVQEEAGAATEITALYAVLSLPEINQLYLIFRGRLIDPAYRAGSESLEAKLFSKKTIPWDKLTYKMTADLLRRYFKERELPHQRVTLPPLTDLILTNSFGVR